MSLSSRLRVILCLMLPALLVFACTLAKAPEAPSPTYTPEPVPPTPTPTVAGAFAEITFDGERCQYEGPESIVEGEMLIVLNNPTDHEFLHLHVFEFVLGRTWQDLVEYLDRPVVPGPMMGTINLRPISVDGDTDLSTRLERYFRDWEYSLDPGSYGIICAAHFPADVRGIWLAGPLEVRVDS